MDHAPREEIVLATLHVQLTPALLKMAHALASVRVKLTREPLVTAAGTFTSSKFDQYIICHYLISFLSHFSFIVLLRNLAPVTPLLTPRTSEMEAGKFLLWLLWLFMTFSMLNQPHFSLLISFHLLLIVKRQVLARTSKSMSVTAVATVPRDAMIVPMLCLIINVMEEVPTVLLVVIKRYSCRSRGSSRLRFCPRV